MIYRLIIQQQHVCGCRTSGGGTAEAVVINSILTLKMMVKLTEYKHSLSVPFAGEYQIL